MMATPRLILALLLLVLGMSLARAEEPAALKGVALVIGEEGYAHLAPLANPTSDARGMAKLLTGLGFEVATITDADAMKLSRSLARFIEDAEGADVALVYYSGHAIEAGGENYLVPVDADLAALDRVNERLVPVSGFLQELQDTVPVAVLLLDGCRTNPFPQGALAQIGPGSSAVALGGGGLAAPRGHGALG